MYILSSKKRPYRIIFLFVVFLCIFALYTLLQKTTLFKNTIVQNAVSTPTPTPFIFTQYALPKIQQKQVYKIAMIGDSMTAALGPHGGALSDYMNSLYKKNAQDPQRIIIDNYAKSSNILAVDTQLTQKATISEYTFGPLLSDNYDAILVESYGYNPLSQFGLDGGLKQQTIALNMLMKTLITTRSNMAIIFVATIAPNRENYARATQPNRSDAERMQAADERIAYLTNHISYAKNHNIPLINIYQDSLTQNGDGNMIYINLTDDIHPSFVGVDFIDHKIGDFIYNNKILPQ